MEKIGKSFGICFAALIIFVFAASCSNPTGGGDKDVTLTPVTISSVTQNGSSSSTTTALTLSFSQAIPGLNAEDITLSGIFGLQKGVLGGSGPVYTLPVSGFSSGGTLSISVSKTGYTISGSPKTVTIYYISLITPVITITEQPVPAINVTEGSINTSLNITAAVTEGAELSYQWYSNTTDSNSGGTPESGAASASFPIPGTLIVGTYYYFCETRAQGAEAVRSNVAIVNVLNTPTLDTTNFYITNNTWTYNGSPHGATINFYGTNINATTAGDIFVSYSGKDGTVYPETTVAPTDGGTYNILVFTLGGTIYSPFLKAPVGTLIINRTIGATVASPVLAAKTHNSITLNIMTASTGQDVIYAINENNTTAGARWQNSETFTDLEPATTYYFFAKAALNINYNEGPSSNGTSITTDQQVGIVSYYWLNDHDEISLTDGSATGNTVTVKMGQTLDISPNESGYSGHQWFVNGMEDTGQTGSSFTFTTVEKEAGKVYAITLLVQKGGKFYNAHFFITITL